MAKQMKRAVVKLQTVTTFDIEYTQSDARDGGHPTIGEEIDDLLAQHTKLGNIPNKLVLDLNPPVPVNPADDGDNLTCTE